MVSVSNSQWFAAGEQDNRAVAKEKCEAKDVLFIFIFFSFLKMAAIAAYLYADINNPAKGKINSTGKRREDC